MSFLFDEQAYAGWDDEYNVPVLRKRRTGINKKTAAAVAAIAHGATYGMGEGIDATPKTGDKRSRAGERLSSSKTRAGTRYGARDPRNVPLPDLNEDLPALPQPNLRRRINTGRTNLNFNTMGSSKRAGTDGDEVSVVPPPKKLSKIHPDYFTINVPQVYRLTAAAANILYASTTPLATIRLNSIYDPLKATRATLNNPAVQSDVQPQGRDIWAAHFKYYRVLKTYVKITFVNNYPTLDTGSFLHDFVVGFELTDEDGPISDNAEMFLMTKHAKREILPSAQTTTAYNGTSTIASVAKSSTKTVTFTYDPNAWDYHVEEKGSEERWTPIGANPSIDHELHVRVMHLINGTTPSAGNMYFMIQLAYDVQFREATDSFFKTRTTASAAPYPDAEGEADD